MLALALLLIAAPAPIDDAPAARWWGVEVEASLRRAPERADDWRDLLADAPPEQRSGFAYLIRDLPEADLRELPTEDLAENVALAYRARAEVPWGADLPEDVFLDAVLPHASVTEPRESMRAEFFDRYLPLVADCETPGEAACRVNEHLFKDYGVSYNTRRLRTDQSSRESIAQGMATCTGLSIMLVEASRAVGVPARLAGIASWPGRGGNHTWVEVWDDGWHFLGAAEPDPAGLDHAWFVGDAAKAVGSERMHAIWAATYRQTGLTFPLVWDRDAHVPAENVTARYADPSGAPPAPPRLMVEVRRGGERVEADVAALDFATGASRLAGKSLGPGADVNRHLSCTAVGGQTFLVVVRDGDDEAVRLARVDDDTVVRIDLDDPALKPTRAAIAALLADRFGDDEAKRDRAAALLDAVPVDAEARADAWEAYKASPLHAGLRDGYEARTVSTDDRTAPYRWRHVGERPEGGWPLVIAMHGGGGVPKRVNDQQWESMFDRYYKDHPEAGGYVYLALRAPNDEWNGFYDDAIAPMVARLIRQFVLSGDVDPDRVVTLGASHGGYGAFVIGPKIPDRFAAIHASAAAPTPGETMGENLRNVPFTFMVGERDTAYGRIDRAREFADQLAAWRAERGGYPGGAELLPDVGHSVPDRDKVPALLDSGPRDPRPAEVVWVQSDDRVKHFYWLESPDPTDGARVEAAAHDNVITIRTEGLDELALWLDEGLVDLGRPVTVEVEGGESLTVEPRPSLETYCRGLDERGDPQLAAPVRVVVPLAD